MDEFDDPILNYTLKLLEDSKRQLANCLTQLEMLEGDYHRKPIDIGLYRYVLVPLAYTRYGLSKLLVYDARFINWILKG